MATKSLESLEETPQGAGLLYITCRAGHILGKYDQALRSCNKALERHASYSESVEIKFRIALIQMRLEKWDDAASAFNLVINSADNKNYELASLYWLYRIKAKLNQNNDEIFKTIRVSILYLIMASSY